MTEEFDDPFSRHFRRDPLPDAGIRVVLLTDLPTDRAEAVIAPLVDDLRSMNREVETRIVPIEGRGLGAALTVGLTGAHLPLVLVTTAEEPWTEAHLKPLLNAIDKCDHVIGRRPVGGWDGFARWLATWPRRLVFAVPLRDIHSPCRLHRLEKLAAIPLQSPSSLVDLEILAKATFFGHLLDEVDVPPLEGRVLSHGWWPDLRRLLREPRFAQPSGPAEEAEREGEGDHRPGGEDGHGGSHIEETGPLQDDAAERTDQLGQGQGLDEPLGGVGEPLGREEDAREEVLRQHDQVHQPTDGLGGAGAAGDEHPDPGEGQGADHVHQDDQPEPAADRHVEHQGAQEQEHGQVGEQEGEPRAQEGQQEVLPGHGGRHEPLEQLADPHVHQHEADAPEPAPHGVDRDQSRDQEVDVA
jgi:hypothetical protein